MMYSRSPGSPSANTVCPRGKSTGCNCLVSADTALGSTPWKIPARLRISSNGGPHTLLNWMTRLSRRALTEQTYPRVTEVGVGGDVDSELPHRPCRLTRGASLLVLGDLGVRCLDHSGTRSSLSANTSVPASSRTAHLRAGPTLRVPQISTACPTFSPKSSTTTPRPSSSVPG